MPEERDYMEEERGYMEEERGYIFVMKIVATFVSACSQGQRTHSAQTNMKNFHKGPIEYSAQIKFQRKCRLKILRKKKLQLYKGMFLLEHISHIYLVYYIAA